MIHRLQPWSAPTTMTAETIAHRNAASMRNFHPKLMSWSYRRRGSDARTQTVP